MKVLIFIALLCPFLSFAKDGSSGCGPGWYVFKENSLVSSLLRGTTNGILGPTTTLGMTLGTSNCSKHKIVMKEKESLFFATNNYYELKKEIASGQGEFLNAFTETLGCRPQISNTLGSELKNRYQQVFNNKEADAKRFLENVYRVIFTNEKISQSCSDLV